MAELEETPCPLKIQRIRKPNFSVAEEILQQEVRKDFDIWSKPFQIENAYS
jgi:hypothetical protein